MVLKSPRAKRTKVEVEQEFSQLTDAIAQTQNSSSSKSNMMEQIQEAEVRATVSEITVEAISQKLSGLNIEISRTLSGLSEKMTYEVQLLCSLKEAVKLESREIERLHGIDVAATSIDQLIADHREKKAAYEAELTRLQQELLRQKEEKKREEAEYFEASKKSRARECEEYEYKKNLERKKQQDLFDEEYRLKEKQNREKQEQLEKIWKEKESLLALREEEFTSLKKESEQFPSRIAAESAKAAKESAKETEAKYSQEIDRLKRDLIVEKQISELKIKQLQDLLTASQAQIGGLQGQLEEAKRQVQDIAVKAIEGASGARALNHINQIAIEQAKNRAQP